MNQTAPATMGHNRPPSPFEEIAQEIADLYEEAKHWADGEPIASEEQHDAVSALYNSIHYAGKLAEEMRVAEVKPHDEAKAVIQAKYAPLIGNNKSAKGKVPLAKDALGDMLGDWRRAVQAEEQAEAERLATIAEEEKRKAVEAVRASSGDLAAREEAEVMLKAAQDAEKNAARAEREANSGHGLRRSRRPVLIDLSAAIQHYWRTHRADFEALVVKLAEKDVRAGKGAIPGFQIIEERKAI